MMVGAGMSARDGNLEAQGESPRQCRGNGVLPPHGGYQNLLSYQRAEVVYDATVRFCQAVFSKYDRMVDQMVQAARSGKQNIVEGSMASGTSREMELKLTNVARGSCAPEKEIRSRGRTVSWLKVDFDFCRAGLTQNLTYS